MYFPSLSVSLLCVYLIRTLITGFKEQPDYLGCSYLKYFNLITIPPFLPPLSSIHRFWGLGRWHIFWGVTNQTTTTTSEERFRESYRVSHMIIWMRNDLGRGTARVKSLRWECAWQIQRTKGPVWLEYSKNQTRWLRWSSQGYRRKQRLHCSGNQVKKMSERIFNSVYKYWYGK